MLNFNLAHPIDRTNILGDPPLFVSLKIDDPPPISAGPTPPVLYDQSLTVLGAFAWTLNWEPAAFFCKSDLNLADYPQDRACTIRLAVY